MRFSSRLDHAAFALGASGSFPVALEPFCARELACSLFYLGCSLADTMVCGEQATDTVSDRSLACMLCHVVESSSVP